MSHVWSIKEISGDIKKTIDNDKDFTIALTGFPGSGKSTLGWHIAAEVDPNFNMSKQMIFTRQDLIAAINTLPEKSAIVIDEAVALLFKRDFANKEQKEVLKILDICRYRNLVLIFCVPNFWSLDNHLLSRIRLRIHIEKRGLAFIFARSGSPFITDPWFRKENEKLAWNWDQYPDAKKCKGFFGIIHFGDMPDYAKKEYLPLKEEKKLLREKEAEKPIILSNRAKRHIAQRDILIRYIIEKKLMNQTQLADMMGLEQAAVSLAMNPETKERDIRRRTEEIMQHRRERELFGKPNN